MQKLLVVYTLLLCLFCGCTNNAVKNEKSDASDSTLSFKYAQNIKMERVDDGIKVSLDNPWKKGEVLHTYYLVDDVSKAPSDGTAIKIPLQRGVFFTTAHANLMEMLKNLKVIAGVADAKYMLIPDVQARIKSKEIVDCGDGMKPDIEKIIDMEPDVLLLSPFENSGGYGKLDGLNIPIIECADYMETSALGRAEWMKFYGMLFGCEDEANALFAEVEKNYMAAKNAASNAKETRSILPDRMVGSVWYLPGGESSVGLLYKDAGGNYAFSNDKSSGSLSMPFETVLDKFGEADFWIMSYNGEMNKQLLLSEYQGYAMLKPFKKGEIYACPADKVPYFEEVSWRPDWLLSDLIQLFHPDLNKNNLRYYKKLSD